MITIKYFGLLAEQAKCQQEHLEFKELTLAELIEDIKTKHQFNSFSFHVALNQKLIQNSEDQKLKYNDEIALLPPFAGG